MLKHRLAFAVLVSAMLGWAAPFAVAGPVADADKPTVVTPTGAYAMAVLEFDTLDTWQLVGGLRDGKMRVDHGIGITREGGWLELKDGKLTGTFQHPPGPLVSKGGLPVAAVVVVDATVTGDRIAGTCSVDGKPGTVKGRMISEDQLRAQNPIPKTVAWPSYLGPVGGGVAATPTGVALVDSLSDARMVWRSEEPIGSNMGSITRFMHTWVGASRIRTSGQSASPVLADGRVFMH